MPWGKIECQGCGFAYGKREAYCPACLCKPGERTLAADAPTTHVRAYPGQTALQRAKLFAKDQARIARVGWRVQSQSNAFMLLTVVYTRDATPLATS